MSVTYPDWSPPPVDGEVGEALRPGAKAHQVGVQILTRAQGPDSPFTSGHNRLRHQVGPDSMGQVTRPPLGATHFLPG